MDYDEKTSKIQNQDIKKSESETCQTVVPELVSNGFWCLSFEFSISTPEIQISDYPKFWYHKNQEFQNWEYQELWVGNLSRCCPLVCFELLELSEFWIFDINIEIQIFEIRIIWFLIKIKNLKIEISRVMSRKLVELLSPGLFRTFGVVWVLNFR